jgi:hypothetical protein
MQDRRILKDRLNKLQKAVHKASEDAWKQHEPSSASQKDGNNASFLLGMDLFGQDVSTLELNIREKLDDVETELNKLSKEESTTLSQTETETSEVDEVFDDPQVVQEQVDLCRNKIAFLKQASLARTAIDESKTLASPTLSPNGIDFVQASRLVVQANEFIRQAESFAASLPQDELNHSIKLISSLKQEVRRQRVQLLGKAGQTLDACVQLSSNSIVVKNAKQLDQAYQVMEQFENQSQGKNRTLQETMRRFTKQLYQEILKPILEQHSTSTTTTTTGRRWNVVESEDTPKSTAYTNKGPVHRLEWNPLVQEEEVEDALMQIDEHASSMVAPWKETFALLQQLLVFMQSKLLRNRKDPSQLVGELLFGNPEAMPSTLNLHALGLESTRLGADKGMLLEDLMELLAKTCLPDYFDFENDTPLTNLAIELKSYVSPFCKAMCQKWMIPMSPQPKLVEFCDKLEDRYVEHRRCVLLNQAREILLQNDYHNTVSVGTSSSSVKVDPGMEIFLLPSCSISDTAHKSMQLVRKSMDEAVAAQASSLELLRPTLYKTAREMLALFRAIVPSSHQTEIRTVPRTAAVLHNDCIFFARHCLTLGLEYKDQFTNDQKDEQDKIGQLLEQTCIFVDMVPLFREMADECLGDMLDMQKQQLVELIQPRIPYLGKSLGSHESLHEWSEGETALAAGIYHLQHLQSAWQSILAKDVFASSMGHLANVLFASFVQQVLVPDLYISPSANQFVSALFGKALQEIGELLEGANPSYCCSEWDRFLAISKFLEINSLSDLQTSLTKGVFRHVTSQELQLLVQATFRDMRQSPEYTSLMNALSTYE